MVTYLLNLRDTSKIWIAIMNNMSNSEQVNNERRVCDRTQLARQMRLQFTDGNTLDCLTEDISLGGVLMVSEKEVTEEKIGQNAKLFFVNEDQQSDEFSCLITRISGFHISIELDRKQAAAFGKVLTKGIFKRQ